MSKQQLRLPKRERTRRKLLEAAFGLVMEKGFADVTVEDVAARAGMTKGAVYGNFQDKDDLLLAMVLANTRSLSDEVELGKSLREYLHNLGTAVATITAPAAGTPSFHAYAVTSPAMIERLTRHYAERFKVSEAALIAAFPDQPLPLPSGQFAALVQAMTMGILSQRLISRGLMSDDTIVAAFEALSSVSVGAA